MYISESNKVNLIIKAKGESVFSFRERGSTNGYYQEIS